MNERPKLRKISRQLQVGDITVDAVVLHPEGGKLCLDHVTVSRPDGTTFHYTPREQSHDTMDGIDKELRQLVKTGG